MRGGTLKPCQMTSEGDLEAESRRKVLEDGPIPVSGSSRSPRPGKVTSAPPVKPVDIASRSPRKPAGIGIDDFDDIYHKVIAWLRWLDLNQPPLGYEPSRLGARSNAPQGAHVVVEPQADREVIARRLRDLRRLGAVEKQAGVGTDRA
jgi:hypothetical protein